MDESIPTLFPPHRRLFGHSRTLSNASNLRSARHAALASFRTRRTTSREGRNCPFRIFVACGRDMPRRRAISSCVSPRPFIVSSTSTLPTTANSRSIGAGSILGLETGPLSHSGASASGKREKRSPWPLVSNCHAWCAEGFLHTCACTARPVRLESRRPGRLATREPDLLLRATEAVL
jgi:hypothetical protein